jgi:[ribosomal protein S18]-alanine N-acetyltransferase
MNIYGARTSDLSEIAQLDREVFGEESYNTLVIRQLFDVFPRLFLIARQRGQLIGFTLGAVEIGAREGWILALAVRSDSRKQGAGRYLTSEVLEIFQSIGVDRVRLTVDPHNNARSLYERIGFGGSILEADYFGAGRQRLVMELRLDKRPQA